MKIFLILITFLYSLLNAHTKFLEDKIYKKPVINKIPKIIHQIWVGKKEIPIKYLEFMEGWKKLHPDWKYKLWTDKDVNHFPWINKAGFLAVSNPGMKSDIWRVEILYRFGGVYLDTDMECIRPLDPIHKRLLSYCGFDSSNKSTVANSVLATVAKNPMYKKFIDEIKYNIKNIKSVAKISDNQIQSLTGPGLITKVIQKNKKLINNQNIILSHEYFQPIGYQNKGKVLTDQERFDVEHSCFAIHHNGCSWVTPKFFPGK